MKIEIGSSFLLIVTILLVILKIAGEITISWWLVFAPILIPLGLLLVFIFFIILLFILHIIISCIRA